MKIVYLIQYTYYSRGVLKGPEFVCRAYCTRLEAALDAKEFKHKQGWDSVKVVAVKASNPSKTGASQE